MCIGFYILLHREAARCWEVVCASARHSINHAALLRYTPALPNISAGKTQLIQALPSVPGTHGQVLFYVLDCTCTPSISTIFLYHSPSLIPCCWHYSTVELETVTAYEAWYEILTVRKSMKFEVQFKHYLQLNNCLRYNLPISNLWLFSWPFKLRTNQSFIFVSCWAGLREKRVHYWWKSHFRLCLTGHLLSLYFVGCWAFSNIYICGYMTWLSKLWKNLLTMLYLSLVEMIRERNRHAIMSL